MTSWNEFSGPARGSIALGPGWSALPGGTDPCQRCGAQPAVAFLAGALFARTCAMCARLGGCPEKVVEEGVSAHGPLARIHGLTSGRMGPGHADQLTTREDQPVRDRLKAAAV
jgi:hypothetical protein